MEHSYDFACLCCLLVPIWISSSEAHWSRITLLMVCVCNWDSHRSGMVKNPVDSFLASRGSVQLYSHRDPRVPHQEWERLNMQKCFWAASACFTFLNIQWIIWITEPKADSRGRETYLISILFRRKYWSSFIFLERLGDRGRNRHIHITWMHTYI